VDAISKKQKPEICLLRPELMYAPFRRVSELDAEWIEAFLSVSLRGLEEGAEPFSAQNPQN
jgi:hypothetical protein